MNTLVRWNPARSRNVRRMQSDMDRLMESFFETPRVRHTHQSNLPLDVAETADSYLISAAVPGLKSEDIDITVEDGILSISGEFSSNFDSAGDDAEESAEGSTEQAESTVDSVESTVRFHIRERRYGSFARKLRLPKDVDADGIEAKQEDGILTITLAKSEAAQPKKITIA